MSLLTNIVDVKWRPRRSIVRNESPFSGRRQVSALRSHRWEFVVTYAKTSGLNAKAKEAALTAMKGGLENFDFRDPSRAAPSTSYTGTGTIDTSASGYSIPVTGLDANTLVARAGDMMSVQISSQWQLFMLASDATTDGLGDVTITVNNPVRGTASNGDAVRFNDWLVTVTLEDDEQWGVDKHGILELPPLRFIEDF